MHADPNAQSPSLEYWEHTPLIRWAGMLVEVGSLPKVAAEKSDRRRPPNVMRSPRRSPDWKSHCVIVVYVLLLT